MKTMTSTLQPKSDRRLKHRTVNYPEIKNLVRSGLAFLGAISLAAGVVMLSIWITSTEMANVYAASVWASGFLFTALAVSSYGKIAFLQLLTAISLFFLVILQSSVSADFAIISGFLLAAWSGALVYRWFQCEVLYENHEK